MTLTPSIYATWLLPLAKREGGVRMDGVIRATGGS